MPTFDFEDPISVQDDFWLFVRAQGEDLDPDIAAPLLKYVDHITFPMMLGQIVRRDPTLSRIKWTAEYPTEPAECPVMVYTLLSRTPGLGGVETFKPRVRYSYTTSDGTRVNVLGQWMTCIFRFDCCANTAQEADSILFQLENLIRNSVWEFQQLGVKEILFQEQLSDMLLPRDEKRIITRSMNWMVQLEYLDVRTTPSIKDIRLQVMLPKAEFVDTVVRGRSLLETDTLSQTYIMQILAVSDPHDDGVAREQDYIEDVDFVVLYNPKTALTDIAWLEPGKRPAPGSTYYVRYLHWTAFSSLFIP